ncbi:MAG: ATP-binding cassette domain-containing protein [Burkholderiaceae bacterium]|nr:ATP-binding cassette domain-containing protein [Burkholderiaceae bacterium]
MNLELQALSARHPAARQGATPALRGLSLRIAAGEQVAIIGPSGAGKTTLLQVLACALPPSAGTLKLGEYAPWQMPRRALQRLRGQLFLAPQVPPLPPRQRTVTAVLAGRLPRMGLLSSVRSLFYPVDIAAAHAALDRFDLADKLFERVDRLSGGERQRVGLARALLAMQPTPGESAKGAHGEGVHRALSGASLLLIDEPLSALDPTRSRQAIAALLDSAQEHGATLVATLHQVDVAMAMFSRIIGLRDGNLAFDLPVAEVTSDHLARLYDQFEHELRGDAPAPEPSTPPIPPPAVMHCR